MKNIFQKRNFNNWILRCCQRWNSKLSQFSFLFNVRLMPGDLGKLLEKFKMWKVIKFIDICIRNEIKETHVTGRIIGHLLNLKILSWLYKDTYKTRIIANVLSYINIMRHFKQVPSGWIIFRIIIHWSQVDDWFFIVFVRRNIRF